MPCAADAASPSLHTMCSMQPHSWPCSACSTGSQQEVNTVCGTPPNQLGLLVPACRRPGARSRLMPELGHRASPAGHCRQHMPQTLCTACSTCGASPHKLDTHAMYQASASYINSLQSAAYSPWSHWIRSADKKLW